MNPLAALNIFKGAGDVVKTVFGSKQDRDSHLHTESMSVQEAYSAEFSNRANRTWWDSLIDGLNRIPRPLFVAFIVYYFVICVKNVTLFERVNRSLSTIPEPMWYILGGILSFYFGSRHFQKMGEMKTGLANVKVLPPIKSKVTAPWYKIATVEMRSDVREVAGELSNKRILEYHKCTDLLSTDDETPWCSAFVNWCMHMAGEVRTNKANARSWLEWGTPLDEPKEGCVVIFQRGNEKWMGHVGFYVGEESDQVLCLGGNQDDMVSIRGYNKSKVLGYRWPK